MKKGFLIGSKRTVTTLAAAAAISGAAASAHIPLAGVENFLGAASVARQKANGSAKPLRVECDFVTCSQ